MEAGDAIALLADPNDPGKVVPQLTGTAVWAALLSRELFDRFVSSEPELLLTSSLADAESGMRRRLLQALLAYMKDRPPGDWHRYYRWLDYRGLPGDIEPYLGSGMPAWLRREAAWILSETGHHELDARLAAIVESAAMARHPADYDGEVRLATSVVACLRDSKDPGLQDNCARSPTMRERRERSAPPSSVTCGGSSRQSRFSACSVLLESMAATAILPPL